MDVLLDRDQPVDVVLDGGWHLTARVASVADEHVDLGPIDGPLALPGELRWCMATMSWRTRLGAAQRRGVLVGGPDATLRLQSLGDPLRIQRRRFVRVPADLSAALIAQDRRLLTRTLDLSVGGMLVSPADTLAIDEPVRFGPLQGAAERALSRYVAARQRELIAG